MSRGTIHPMEKMTLADVYSVYDHETYLMQKLNDFREIADIDEDSFLEFFQFCINDAED